MDNEYNSKADLQAAIELTKGEVESLQKEEASIAAEAQAEIDRRNFDVSQANNEASSDLAEAEGRLKEKQEIAKAELRQAKLRAKMHFAHGASSAAKLHDLDFNEHTTPEDIENAVERLSEDQVVTRRQLRYGKRIEVGNWKLIKIIFGALTCLMSGIAVALLMHQIDLRDPFARPWGLLIVPVAGALIAIGVSYATRPWLGVGGAIARNASLVGQLLWLIPITLTVSLTLASTDAAWIVKANLVRSALNSSEHIPIWMALAIGGILSCLYVWSHAFVNMALGYNTVAASIIANDQEDHIETQRESQVFQTYSQATKKQRSEYLKALADVARLENLCDALNEQLDDVRKKMRGLRKPLSNDPRPDHAKRLMESRLAITEAERRLADLQRLIQAIED